MQLKTCVLNKINVSLSSNNAYKVLSTSRTINVSIKGSALIPTNKLKIVPVTHNPITNKPPFMNSSQFTNLIDTFVLLIFKI